MMFLLGLLILVSVEYRVCLLYTSKNRKGFTLVELVVVIAILGIVAGLAIPRLMDATTNARGSRSVSYTHLDVYKRQVLKRTVISAPSSLARSSINCFSFTHLVAPPTPKETPSSVSYTHLDVYKRQGYKSTPKLGYDLIPNTTKSSTNIVVKTGLRINVPIILFSTLSF